MLKIIQLIKDFLIYREIFKEVSERKLTKELKLKLSAYNKDTEREIWEVVMAELIKMNFEEKLSRDYILGFRQAIMIKNWLCRDYVSTHTLDKD